MILGNIKKISKGYIVRTVVITIILSLFVTINSVGVDQYVDTADLLIESWSPLADPTTTVGTPLIFSIYVNSPADITWSIDNSAVQSDTDVLTSSYVGIADIGVYDVSVLITDDIDSTTKDWKWKVKHSGDLVIYVPSAPIITYTMDNFWINYIVNPDKSLGTNNTDSISVSLDGKVTWQNDVTPGTNFNISVGPHGHADISAIAHNNSGGTSDTTSKNVSLANNIPVLDPIGDKTVAVGSELSFTVHATDLDGDDITYSKDVAKGDLDSSTGTYSWTPKKGDIGTHVVTISSYDGNGGTDSKTATIIVVGDVPGTYMPPIPVSLNCTQGNFRIYCIWQPGVGNNTDGYRVDVDKMSNETTGNNTNITTGPHQQKNISVYARNNSGEGSLNPIPISESVQMINNVPVQIGIGDKSVTIGQMLTFAVNATDQDGDAITYSTNTTKGLYNSSTNVYSWTPNSSDVGTYTWLFCSNDSYGGNVCETITVTVSTSNDGNTGNNGNTGSSSGSSSGGGSSGAGTSGENYYNIQYKERRELFINKDVTTSYKFDSKRGPVIYVNITGNENKGEITGIMEVLKDRSSFLEISAPGNVYKNINIWIGTIGFAIPKNIKFPTKITFRVENSWIDKNSVIRDNIKMVRWNGGKWVTLDTLGKIKDNNYTYFDANTDGFTHFAITELKSNYVQIVIPTVVQTTVVQEIPTLVDNQTPNQTEDTSEASSNASLYGFDMFSILLIISLVIMVVYIIRKKE